jgi:hypothetical protein
MRTPVPQSHKQTQETKFEHEILLLDSHKNKVRIRKTPARKGKWDNPSSSGCDLYTEGVQFEFRLVHQPPWLKYLWISQYWGKILNYVTITPFHILVNSVFTIIQLLTLQGVDLSETHFNKLQINWHLKPFRARTQEEERNK